MFNVQYKVMNYFYFVGIDVSKLSFDASIINFEGEEISYAQFPNNDLGLKGFLKWVQSYHIPLRATLFCAEDMGSYVSNLALYSIEKKFDFALACALTLKRSLGIARGKNDKIDSLRIARFALVNQKRLTLYQLEEHAVSELKSWIVLRENFVKQKVSLNNIIHSFKMETKLKHNEKEIVFAQKRLEELKALISDVEDRMKEVIESNETVNKNFQLLTSIVGVGLITATVLITSTGNFTKFDDCRKYACYCGIAPFPYSSGTSIRGKTKTSKLANIRIKTYLSRAAVVAKKYDKQIQKYYIKKLEEKKNKLSVLNAIRNKVVARCFAVVSRGKPYVNLQI